MDNGGAAAGLQTRTFKLPKGCSIREFEMRELTAEDELEAARMVDAKLVGAEKNSVMLVMAAERKEAERMSLVSVDGQRVDNSGAPFMGMNKWTQRTMRFVTAAFAEMNGVQDAELKKFLAEVGSAAPATSASAPPATDDSADD